MGEYTSEYTTSPIDQRIHRLTDTALTVFNNEKIEDKLNVVMVYSNVCHFKRRKYLAEQFRDEMLKTPDVALYIVELAYGNDPFELTYANNKNHLQLRTSSDNVLWEKECMINLGVQKLLPTNWKAFAWVDCDISFDSIHWASDTLKILNGHRDVVQLFNICLDLDKDGNTMSCYHSLGYQYETRQKYYPSQTGFSHSGYAYACTRRFYDNFMKSILECEILGSADYKLALAFFNMNTLSYCDDHKKILNELKERVKYCRLGYVPTVITHHFHGSKDKRGYNTRYLQLVKYKFNPKTMLDRDEQGLLVPSNRFPKGLLAYIKKYMLDRSEDE